jgi:hypothetical protein
MTPTKAQLIILITLLSSCRPTEDIEQLKKGYDFDFGVYVEKVALNDSTADRYTRDNLIYTPQRKFIFDYTIIRDGDSLKIQAPVNIPADADHERTWDFIAAREESPDKIETISITVTNRISNDQQTEVKYDYQYSVNPGFEPFSSTSGVIENKMNTWMHPHRDKYFMILELNPFPYIQKPFEPGKEWTWSLEIGDYWKDQRWKVWTGSIKNEYQYEITGHEKLQTAIGTLDCWVVNSTATSRVGVTELKAFYNEKYGFVKLDFVNIDKSMLNINIKKVLESPVKVSKD